MGYTHYWYLPEEISTNEWGELIRDVEKILNDVAVNQILLTEFEVSDERITFNGAGDDAFETFYLVRTKTITKGDMRRFGFCKTARKPYDLVVVAVLLALVHNVTDSAVDVKSDGGVADWEPGAIVVNQSCGYYDGFDPDKVDS